MKKISIKLKVTLWYTLSMIIVSAIVLLAMNAASQQMIRHDISERLIQTVDEASHMRFVPDNHPVPGFRVYSRGVHLMLYNDDGELIGGQVPFGITDEPDFSDEIRTKTYDGSTYYIYDKQVKHSFSDNTLWVKGIISATDEAYAISSVMKNNFLLTAIIIVLASFGGYLIINRAFVPVNKITKTAKRIIASGDLSQRIELGDGKDEIYSLAGVFDEMLDKIEQAFEREKQFTSDASHELRTPVAVILSECEYMTECARSSADFTESASSIKRQAERMSKLIGELLTLSRMDKNTLKINLEETDISELASFVCDEQEEIASKDIELIRRIDVGICASVDRFLLARLFINLVSNAYQYSDDGGKIEVSLKEDESNIIFGVSDTGIGIAKEELGKIWERFYQSDTSRTANENGSMGLGLSMVKHIAECHGGSVSVESELGVGSKFVFTLPKSSK